MTEMERRLVQAEAQCREIRVYLTLGDRESAIDRFGSLIIELHAMQKTVQYGA